MKTPLVELKLQRGVENVSSTCARTGRPLEVKLANGRCPGLLPQQFRVQGPDRMIMGPAKGERSSQQGYTAREGARIYTHIKLQVRYGKNRFHTYERFHCIRRYAGCNACTVAHTRDTGERTRYNQHIMFLHISQYASAASLASMAAALYSPFA